jgi:hypothetical protein
MEVLGAANVGLAPITGSGEVWSEWQEGQAHGGYTATWACGRSYVGGCIAGGGHEQDTAVFAIGLRIYVICVLAANVIGRARRRILRALFSKSS